MCCFFFQFPYFPVNRLIIGQPNVKMIHKALFHIVETKNTINLTGQSNIQMAVICTTDKKEIIISGNST